MDNRPIGVFDSGYGGLSVLKELKKVLPDENYIYFGDNKRTPYGSQDKDTIIKYSEEVVEFLVEKGAKIIVLACNTVTANALDFLENTFNIPIIGIISTGAEVAIKESQNKKIVVLATESTIKSGVYKNTLKNIDNNVKVESISCPKLVPLIEKGDSRDEEIYKAAKEYYSKINIKNFDTIILGCTHYPHILDIIEDVFGKNIIYVNPAVKLSEKISKYLEISNLRSSANNIGNIDFYTSGELSQFIKNGSFYYGEGIVNVKSKVFN